MIEGNAGDCLQALQGELLQGSETHFYRGVSINSRTLRPDELFFCIRGERFDGHDFLREAAEKNAAGIILADKEKIPASPAFRKGTGGPFIIRVKETLTALQNLAHFHRMKFPVRVVGVTGTNGKSTTKEMIASMTETKFKVLKNKGNLNNHIGLPLSLMELDPDHEVAVMEMGMSALNEIRRLAEIARPEIGLITNISEGHLLQLKTLKNVQAAKGELFESLDEDGTAIVNADDPLVLELARSLQVRTITFGINNPADVGATDIRPRLNNGFDFTVNLFREKFSLRLPFLGFCNIYNALAAMAACHSLGIDPEAMVRGMGNCRLLSQRYEIFQHNSMTFINDAYNANPRSMREALKTLSGYETGGRKFFVIGDMLELGDLSESAHTQLGEAIAEQSIDVLVAVGRLASFAARGAVDKGMEKDRVLSMNTHEEAVDYLRKNGRKGDCLLFKGSRGAGMEEVIHGLTQN